MENNETKNCTPTHTGWYWFRTCTQSRPYHWYPARVIFVAGDAEYLVWGHANTTSSWRDLAESKEEQWGGEIKMEKGK